MSRKAKSKSITLALPEEFIALCASDGVAPELVLRGFIADRLCCTSRKADEITPAPDATMPRHPRAPCSGARVA